MGQGSNDLVIEPQNRLTEEQQIREWRYDEFRRLGFSYSQARMLLFTEFKDEFAPSVALARKLIGQGCSVDTAFRILDGSEPVPHFADLDPDTPVPDFYE